MLRKRDKEEAEIPSASLADIAFLLLIFFLVATTIDVDKGLRLVLPPPAEDMEEVKIKSENITNILINDAGEVLLDNEIVPVRDIERIIRDKMAKNDKLIVSLKTTRGTKYKVYIAVLDQLKRANATRISIAEPDEA